MPSFHLRKRLNRLRSNSSKPEPQDEIETDSPDADGKAPFPLEPSGQSRSSTSTLVPPETAIRASSTYSTRAKSPLDLTDPLGLRVVHLPEDKIKADIVFIHGLGGSSRMTWSKDKNIELFWPGQFLPLENDICQARISTFGYHADIKSGAKTTSSILDFAKDLLYALKYEQRDETKDLRIGQVPLIFVAHSMGGLIVKEAYLQGQYDPAFSDIIKAVSSIIFLSTPHRGTNLAETLNRILQVSPLSRPKPYIAELVQNSFTIQKLNEQFRHVAPKLNIISFYETLPTAVARGTSRIVVLEKESSVLGYPGEVSKGLDADHHTVCKYDSPQDPKYLAVCNYLKSKISTIFSQQPRQASPRLSTTASSQASVTTKLKTGDLENIFDITEPVDTDYVFFRDRWTPGTCGWILKSPSFANWINGSGSQSSSMLWIHGLPGSGKSIMSSYLIDHLIQAGYACQYFFIQHGDSRKRSLSSIFRSLAFQTAQSCPVFLQAIARVSTSLTLRGADARTIWQRIFRSILFKQEISTPLFWVIDGFDECDDIRTGIKLLAEVLDLPISMRILVTSRWNPEVDGALKRLSSTHDAIASINLQDNIDDCRTFIRHELDWGHIPEFQERISNQLLQQAEGSFLWTRLTVDRINKCHTAAAVEQALHELHPGMEELYHQMAANITHLSPADASLATRILSWVCCTQQKLAVVELAQALEPEGRDIIDLQRSIVALCSGFVVLDNDGSVAMIHQTARDFLVQSNNKTFRVDRKQSHAMIALRCLQILATPGLRRKVRLGQAPILLNYATRFVWAHVASCNPLPGNVIDAFIKFLRGPDVLTWIQALADAGELHVMVQASDYLSTCTSRLDSPDGSLDLLLVNGWASDLGKLVGKFGRQLLRQPESIHTSIAPFCPISSMIHKQLAHRGHQEIAVTGIGKDWDDSVGRLSFPFGYDGMGIVSGGHVVAVAVMAEDGGKIVTYRVDTHEEIQQLNHGERIRSMQIDQFGTMLVSCGYATTIIWNLETGECISRAPNPPTRPFPQTVIFDKEQQHILIGTNDRRLWTIPMSTPDAVFTEVTRIIERRGGANSPTCMALSPDGQFLALGYRQHGLTVWDLESHEPVASHQDLTRATQLVWHPHSGELFGLLQDLSGRIFKWYPDKFKEPETKYAEASSIAVSDNGSVLAVGDQHGMIKLLSSEDLTVLYQVRGQGPVLAVAFSSDCRQLYDVRRTHANVWQSNMLLKLAEPTPELSDLDSDSDRTVVERETPSSLPKNDDVDAVQRERVDPITALAAQTGGTLYCTGTLGGVVQLYDTRSRIQILELRRSENSFSIQQISWSNDGTMVCYADVSRTVYVDLVVQVPSTSAGTALSLRRLVEVTPHGIKDNISQVLFQPSGSHILVSSLTASVVIKISDQTIATVDANGQSLTDALEVTSYGRWCNLPSLEDKVVLVNDTSLKVFNWPPSEMMSLAAPRHRHQPRESSPIDGNVTPGRPNPRSAQLSETLPLFTTTAPNVLVSPSGTYLLTFRPQSARSITLNLWKVQVDEREVKSQGSASGSSKPTKNQDHLTVVEFELPSTLLKCLAHPLGFLPSPDGGERLVFLDRDAWICTWTIFNNAMRGKAAEKENDKSTMSLRLSNQRRNRDAVSSAAKSSGITTHYSIPSDWVCPDTLSLFRLLSNGALACPTDGMVIIIECKELGKG